ncbi:MAG TPA: cyclic nucleotide-binding domain-containing protein [Chloroflexota bacterium]|jgi:CRP-like cAMP-binding protein
MVSRADALKDLPLFAGLSGKDREFIASYMDEVSFAQGATLITQGQSNDRFFVLVEGEADVTISGQLRQTQRPGSFFGEISMQRGGPATATVVARTPLRAYVMEERQFGALSRSPEVLSRLQAAIGDRLAHDRLVLSWHE